MATGCVVRWLGGRLGGVQGQLIREGRPLRARLSRLLLRLLGLALVLLALGLLSPAAL
jgi:hypothetical protein